MPRDDGEPAISREQRHALTQPARFIGFIIVLAIGALALAFCSPPPGIG
jgi:hypothetical protein